MIDQLLSLIQENTQDAVVKNTSVPDEHNEEIQKEILNSIQGGLSSAISGGNIGGVMDLFSQGANAQNVAGSPMVNNISQNLIGTLGQKFGLSKEVSENIVASVLPLVISQFTKKVADPNDTSIDMNSVVKAATNNKKASGVDFNDILGKFSQGKGAELDLGSIAGSLLSGGSEKSGGGIINIISGFFKKR